jgi:hypothetical protein
VVITYYSTILVSYNQYQVLFHIISKCTAQKYLIAKA